MRITQLTDLHLRHHLPGTAAANTRRSRRMPAHFALALQAITKQQTDLLVLTGDLLDAPTWLWESTYGFETDEPAPWLEAVLADYRLIKKMLDETGLQYMVLPGNHDHPDLFWQVFDRSENIIDIKGHRVVRFCDREADRHYPRRFTTERRRFNAMLADESSPPQVHLQHYVIHPEFNEHYPHTYYEGKELSRRLAASDHVRLSISGHYHQGTDLLSLGKTSFVTGPAFCESPYAWRTYDMQDSDIQMQTHNLLEADQNQNPSSPRVKQPAVFLDRDGVINDLASYQVGPEAMQLIPGSAKAIAKLKQAGMAVVGVTSQSCIGGGYVPASVVVSVNDKMHRLLAQDGAYLDAIYYSQAAGEGAIAPEYVDMSQCKPLPFHLHQAEKLLDLDLSKSWMVGDRITDIQTARNAGVKPILVLTGDGKLTRDQHAQELVDVPVADDLAAAVQHMLANTSPTGS